MEHGVELRIVTGEVKHRITDNDVGEGVGKRHAFDRSDLEIGVRQLDRGEAGSEMANGFAARGSLPANPLFRQRIS